jgi:hypothetical protein
MSRLDSLVRSYRLADLERRYDAKIPPHMLAHADRGPISDDERIACALRSLAWFEQGIAELLEKGKTDAAERYRVWADELRKELHPLMGDAFGPRACEPSPSVSALRAAPAIAEEIRK